MNLATRIVPLVVLSIALSPQAQAQGKAKREPIDAAGIARLAAETGAQVSVSEATGAARFVKIAPGKKLGLQAQGARLGGGDVRSRAAEFFANHGSVFGITNVAADLKEIRAGKDRQGGTHITYQQTYRGLPVFAGELRSHFDAADELVAVNGTFVPDIMVDSNARRTAEEAGKTAVAKVTGEKGKAGKLSVVATTLLVFREGLAKGVPGPNHLAWQVEVSDGLGVREFVFVDAHTGKFIDQITGVYDGLNRRAYNAMGATAPGVNYPATPFWVEGQPFPTGTPEADNMIQASGEIHGLFLNAFSRDSFDGAGAIMDSIFNRGNGCPNASWNGQFISFCPGTTTDDITAHEWGHAYTQYTHDLIYQWQPGALNESYSDIWGETIDRINGRGLDTPGGARTTNSCTAFTPLAATLAINSPAGIAGNYPAGFAQFGPPLTPGGLTGDVVLVNDGIGNAAPPTGVAGDLSVMDGCETPFVNAAAVAGKIAMIYRGTCTFAVKVKNAQLNGATGVIIANHAVAGNGFTNMSGVDATITIPSLNVGNANGELIRAQLASTVNATLRVGAGNPIDNSYRWLMGEESTAFGGAIRDMWNPTCYGNAGKVSDAQYTCSAGDEGGVHSNSGVPNHAYALLVDGGTYNGQTIGAIGLTKAAHVYFRAMSAYQGPASDFADHADALDQSCSDLVGLPLTDLLTGGPSGQVITATDCAQVAKAALAVELRTPPTQCNFQPILAKTPPNRCEAGTVQANIFKDTFEAPPAGWSVAHVASNPEFTPRDWQWTSGLPDRSGSAMFGIDFPGGTCAVGGDESGALQLFSPIIALPAGAANPRLTFDHWVATEAGWDGGNLKISVNGGPWQVVAAADYTYNPYNAVLATVAAGNTNPMAGEPAFTGTDGGNVGGSWGRSHVNLANYAAPGSTIQLRFDIGNDGCTGITGWYVDDPTVYACVPAGKPALSVADVAVTEGNSGFVDANFTVSLSHASAVPVTVWYITTIGTALPLLDFIPELQTITIPPLQLSANISVKVRGEKLVEKDETFFVQLFLPHNGTISDGVGKGTIVNDDTRGH